MAVGGRQGRKSKRDLLKTTTMEKPKLVSMHFGADALSFRLAEELRIRMTKAEVMLWEALRDKQLDGIKFRRQHPVGRFIVDFYCHKYLLVIELDGRIHLAKDVKEKDLNREAELKELGLHIIRFKNEEVLSNLEEVKVKIIDYIKTLK